MGFRGQEFAFDSPGAAVCGMIERIGLRSAAGQRNLRIESAKLDAARGRVLAECILADRDSPPFDYSAMDGYAVRALDLARAVDAGSSQPQVLARVVGEARIGCEPPDLPEMPGWPSAIRIVTGAAIPPGADAVIRREEVLESDGTSISMAMSTAAKARAGDNIRRRGENARAGDRVLDVGTVISAAAAGTLAAVGRVQPLVYSKLRVAVITTGDELVTPETSPREFEIRNSNASVIGAVFATHLWIEVLPHRHAGDESGELHNVLREALRDADAVIVTGGVSMGHRDRVRDAVESAGAEVVFHGLPQRPGKPMLGAIAQRADGGRVPVFGLPGNPVSAMVTCTRIVLPVLAACAGVRRLLPPAAISLTKSDGKSNELWWHRLVCLNERGEAELVDGRGSGDIIAGGRSDGFIEVPPAATATGTLFPFYSWPT